MAKRQRAVSRDRARGVGAFNRATLAKFELIWVDRPGKHCKALGLTAADQGTLLGVSAQTIYNWEICKSKPRQQPLTAIAAMRSMGKRQAKAQLANQQA